MPSKLLLLIFLLALSRPVTAQPEKGQFEVSGSIGIVSGRYLSDNYAVQVGGAADMSETPNYFVSGKYFITDRVALGLTCGEQVIHGEYNMSIGNGPDYTFKKTDVAYAAEVTFVYVKRPFIILYMLAGIGYGVSTQYTDYVNGTHTKQHIPLILPTMQNTPLGLRFGGRLAGFAEVGFGYKGLVNAGVCYAIGRTEFSKSRAIR